MNTKIIGHINRFIELTNEEAEQFAACFKEVNIKKRQFIVQPNFIPKYRNFILSGAMRGYVIGKNGEEHTILLGIENWWMNDTVSYIYQQPASMFVVALEDSILLQLSFEKEQELKKAHHHYETFFRIVAELGHTFQQRRLIANLTLSAKDRYENFLEKYPLLVQRVPQYALASYLGMTTEFLSRIRNQIRKAKS